MNTKTILGITLAAVFAISAISAQNAIAGVGGSPLPGQLIGILEETGFTISGGNIEEVRFDIDELQKKNGFGGFAILTEGHVLAVTDHRGFYDSEAQKAPKLPPVLSISDTAAVCDASDKGCDSKWHTHLVEPIGSELCATGLAVGKLTFEEPSEKVKVQAKKIILKNISLGTSSFTESLSSAEMDFTVGLPVDFDVVSGDETPFRFDGVVFDLTPTFDGEPSVETLVVCIGPLAGEPEE